MQILQPCLRPRATGAVSERGAVRVGRDAAACIAAAAVFSPKQRREWTRLLLALPQPGQCSRQQQLGRQESGSRRFYEEDGFEERAGVAGLVPAGGGEAEEAVGGVFQRPAGGEAGAAS